jgi:TetR/AcrR family transcriptional regulator, cholesterol catabolism regulator
VPARILRAAATLFRTQGYAVTTMRDIASAVGLSKAGLYHHYSRKEDLFNDIASGGTSALMMQLRAVQSSDLDPAGKLREFMKTRMIAIADYQDMLKSYRGGVTDLIEDARAAGTVRDDIDAHLLMLAIDGMTGWSYLWMRPGQQYSPAEVGERFWAFLDGGIRPPGRMRC